MRSVPVAILVSSAFLLAGCSGGGEKEDLHYVCPGGMEIHQDDHPSANTTGDLAKFCPKTSTSGSKSNSTSAAPNVLPTLVLNITDSGGNVTPVTLVDGNLTFDATGSSDPDGTIAGIAVTVTDSNTTRTATLYDAGKKQFKTATFTFDRAGVVNVTVAMVDDRAGFTVNQTHVYVNEIITTTSSNIAGPRAPTGFHDCTGGTEANTGELYEAQFYKKFNFNLVAGATKVEAMDPLGSARITICKPDGTSVSGTPNNPTATTPDADLTPGVGIDQYYVAVYLNNDANKPVSPVITVHYEPQPAAAA